MTTHERHPSRKRQPVSGSLIRALSGSLFDRLALDDEEETVNVRGDPLDGTVRSIKRNLARVLNVRTGGASAAPKLGIVDFNDCAMHSSDLARAAATSIRDCIVHYEPRLINVKVEHISDPDNPLLLQFSISAQIPVTDGKEQIRIDIMMEEGRSCRVV